MGNDASKHEWNKHVENSKKKLASGKKVMNIKPDDVSRGFTFDEFEIFSELGAGAFAEVFLAMHKTSQILVALKILEKRKVLDKAQEEHVNTERKLLSSLDFPFIIKLHLSFQMNTALCMGLEYVPGGELFDLLRKQHFFTERQSIFYAAQIVMALEHMHELEIIYRDLKPENILLDARGYVKVADLGFAKIVPKRTYTMCGTPEYIAPEILAYKGYGLAVDWWALGILIYEMLCGVSPFYAEDVVDIYSNIMEAKVRFPRDMKLSRAARHLVKHLLEKDLSKRFGTLHAGVTDIRDHPWFEDLEWKSVFQGEIHAPFKCKEPKFPNKMDKNNIKRIRALTEAELRGPIEMERFADF